MQQAVKPEGGRKEGAISAWIDSQGEKVKQAIGDAFLHPENLVNAGELGALKLVAAGPMKSIGYGMTKGEMQMRHLQQQAMLARRVKYGLGVYEPARKHRRRH